MQAKLFRRRLRPIHKLSLSLSTFPSWYNTYTTTISNRTKLIRNKFRSKARNSPFWTQPLSPQDWKGPITKVWCQVTADVGIRKISFSWISRDAEARAVGLWFLCLHGNGSRTLVVSKASPHVHASTWLISIIHSSHMISIQPLNFSPTHNSLTYSWFISPLIPRWTTRIDHVVTSICEKSMFLLQPYYWLEAVERALLLVRSCGKSFSLLSEFGFKQVFARHCPH